MRKPHKHFLALVFMTSALPSLSNAEPPHTNDFQRHSNTNMAHPGDKPVTLNQVIGLIKDLKEHRSIDQPDNTLRFAESIPFPDAHSPTLSRAEQTIIWMQLLATIDEGIDPSYDSYTPGNAVALRVAPPPKPSGGAYPSGIAPSAITDPIARSQYETALAENQRKANQAAFQKQLRRVRQLAELDTERFLRRFYSSSTRDQNEVDNCMRQVELSEARKEKLRSLLGS